MPDAVVPPPRLDLRSTGHVLRRSCSSLLASLPSLLLASLLLLLFRSAILAGTLTLSSVADSDPAVKSLLSRLSSSPSPPPSSYASHIHRQRRRSTPFLQLTRAGTLTLDDDDFFSDPDFSAGAGASDRLSSLLRRNRPLSNYSYPFLAADEAAASLLVSPKPFKIRVPPSPSSPFFFSLPKSVPTAADVEDHRDRAVDFRIFGSRGIDLDRQDAAAILYLLVLLSSAHALAILGFVVAYSSALGIVFFAVACMYLSRPVSVIETFFSGARLGIRRLTGFVFLRWAARDALVQFLCLWFFADIYDQTELFKLFVRVKLMPLSLSPVNPWPTLSGPNDATLSGFFFVWTLLDFMVSVVFTVVPWVVIMDRNMRRPGRDAVKEGCYLVSLMPSQAILIKWSETFLCGSLGTMVVMILGGRFLSGLFYSLAEVYFMVVWLIFYFAARCKDSELEGRRFGQEDLEDCINGHR
ncbi:uncharacterized protein [Typha latifolia]|uniref:uncharacterized protein n=1 Tax=Typha latifolia TaxID=4733 RepID=UPI003C2EBF20